MSRVFRRRLSHWNYPEIVRGEGVYLYDREGRRYLDGSSGAIVVTVGHGVPEIAEAIREQAGRLAYVHGTEFTSTPMEELAALLTPRAPVDDARLFLVAGGSEATETAIKLARQYHVARDEPGRYKIVFRWPSYHGATLGALSISGRPSLRTAFAPLLHEMPGIPAPYAYRCALPGCGPACSLECARALETTLKAEGPDTVAAFIAEPVIGASAGAVVPPPEYYHLVREICDRYGVLFIADEVMTGMGRTGKWFGIEHWGVRPDVITTGKGLTSGYLPGGAVLVKGEIVEALKAGGGFHHGFTYSHHPVVAAVGLAVVRYVERHGLVERARVQGAYLQQRLQRLLDLPAVGDVRGLGLMAAVELVQDRKSKAPYPADARLAQTVQAEALRRGVNVYASGGQVDGAGDLVMVGPPLTIEREQIDEVVAVLGDAIAAVTRA
ncbi:MAG: aspartate aminotransferase family protein [Candidatus Rokubacteria bacterium]|nr:aspartate aminotransferase family protein [Candidatus Rokubacteria bacterium]